MYYMTKLDESTRLLIEAEASGAFSKSDLEEIPDPETALLRAIDNIGAVGRRVADVVGAQLRGTGCAFEVAFSLKLDSAGLVMIAQRPDDGQIKVSIIQGG